MATKVHRSNITLLFILPVLVLLIGQLASPAAGDATTTQPIGDHRSTADDVGHGDNTSDEHPGEGAVAHAGGVHVAAWNLKYVELPLTVTFFALFVGVAKIGFHHANFLSAIFPESILLIVIGVVFGGISYASGMTGSLDSQTFFLYLLPPIILEASYSLHDRTFIDNLGSILIFAVVGTLMNTFLIGLTLYAFSVAGAYGSTFTIGLVECLVFSSLISAVDPVAVLAIFQEIHVNHVLYFLVFGESLLNDAVTVVLYNMMNSFVTLETIPFTQIALGFVSFFTVSLGGVLIGIIVGLMTAFITRFTKHVRVVEPLTILGMAYLSYLLAELFHFSGILSIICCGLAQVQYAFANISRKSSTTVTYFTKMLSTTTESLIFLQLGQTLWAEKHQWNTGFVLLTLLFISIYRAVGVVTITFVVNKFRMYKINKEEKFIMSYGGLRGAVAFSLVATLKADIVPVRNVLVTTTLVVILFTVFVQGITIKPLVKLFRIKRTTEDVPSVAVGIFQTTVDHMMAGIEEIIGYKGHNYTRVLLDDLDTRFMKRFLQREPETWEAQVMATFEEITNHDHHDHIFKVSPGQGDAEEGDEKTEETSYNPMLASAATSVYFGSLRHRHTTKDKSGGGSYAPITDKTTPAEVAAMIRKNPGDALHRKYDKNLITDDSQDLSLLMRQRSETHTMSRELVKSMPGAQRWKRALRSIKEVRKESGSTDKDAVPGAGDEIVIAGVEDEQNDDIVKVDVESNAKDADSRV